MKVLTREKFYLYLSVKSQFDPDSDPGFCSERIYQNVLVDTSDFKLNEDSIRWYIRWYI